MTSTNLRRSQDNGNKRRSDFGSYDYSPRDDRGLLLTAQQKFIAYDHLGQHLAPNLEPALDEPEDEQENLLRSHGGRRNALPWPQDRRKRLHAVAEIVRRWEKKMGFAESWKPWANEPPWARITALGLRNLGLDWNEIPFPEDRHRLSITSHTYLISQMRLHLARGGSNAPTHIWISEHEIEAANSKTTGQHFPHRPDGILVLQTDSSFPLKRGDTLLEEIPLKRGQRIAIEVECSRKSFERLGNHILPSLLEHYDFGWYFCGNKEVYDTIVAARRMYLPTDEERKRIRILLMEEKGLK